MSRLARWRYKRLLARMAGPRLLRGFAAAYPEAFFVEIGANDGEQQDHLHPIVKAQPWRGILVEPVPYVFERLQANYAGNERLTLVNAAIAPSEGTMPFFHLREAAEGEAVPDWYDALGSFSRDFVLRHARDIPDVEARIVEIEVPTLTFDALLERHGAPAVDLVLVDTEGFDWEVIRSIDLERHRPRLLIYEHYHLSREERATAARHLRRCGYETKEEGFDTFCLRAEPDDPLLRMFRRLKPAVGGVAKYDEEP